MDDKTTAALREVFEARFGNDSERLERNADGDYVHPAVNFCWVDGWFACYQHLAPMVEDAERLDWLVSNDAWIGWSKDHEYCSLYTHDEDGRIVPFAGWKAARGHNNPREAIDAAREQEKKTC